MRILILILGFKGLKNDIIIKRNTRVKGLIATQKPSFNRFLNTLKDSPR